MRRPLRSNANLISAFLTTIDRLVFLHPQSRQARKACVNPKGWQRVVEDAPPLGTSSP
jgi:hypothetical protein